MASEQRWQERVPPVEPVSQVRRGVVTSAATIPPDESEAESEANAWQAAERKREKDEADRRQQIADLAKLAMVAAFRNWDPGWVGENAGAAELANHLAADCILAAEALVDRLRARL